MLRVGPGAGALVFDLRGYPNGNHGLIKHLIATPDTTSGWMQLPRRVYPDHREPELYHKLKWIQEIQPELPYLGDKHDGSRLHGIGFLPDIYVTRTVAAVRRGEDECLEAALTYLRERKGSH